MIIDISRRSFLKKEKMPRQFYISGVVIVGFICGNQSALAQLNNDNAAGGGLIFEPRISINETYSNNVDLSRNNPKSDFLTEISPGFHWSNNHGRIKGDIDYTLNQLLYAKNSNKNEIQNALNANLRAELVDNWAFIDVNGSISQQYISAFGTPSVGNSNISDNKTEVSAFKYSPYIRGEFLDFAAYEARYTSTIVKRQSNLSSDINSEEGLFRLNSRELFNRLRWNIDLTKSVVDYDPGRKTTSDVLRGTLQYPIWQQVVLSAIVGRESDNFITVQQDSRNFSGGGIVWTPEVTTKLSANTENHNYGRIYNISFEHRTPRTGWYFSDSRNVSITPVDQGTTSLGTIYDLFFSQFASIEPDPVKRAKLVNSFLNNNGIDPGTQIVGGYSNSGLSLQRTQSLTFALLGVRDTLTFTALRSNSQRLTEGSGLLGDFSNSQIIQQNGITLGYSHKLTPDSVFSVLLSQQASSGDSNFPETKLRSLGLNYSTRLSKSIFTTLGIRRTISSGESTSYQETAVTGGLNLRF